MKKILSFLILLAFFPAIADAQVIQNFRYNDSVATRLQSPAGDYFTIGTSCTTGHSLNSANDIVVCGETDTKGDAFHDGRIRSEAGVNETISRVSIMQTPTSGTVNTVLSIEAQGTFWNTGSRGINIISDDNDAIPITINNGSADTLFLERGGNVVTEGNISLLGGGLITSDANGDITVSPNGFGATAIEVGHNVNSFLVGNTTPVGSVTNATSNTTTTITKASHGLSAVVAAGDLLHVTDTTTTADEGFYRVVSVGVNTFVVDRALTGSDADVDLIIWKDVISFHDTDGTNGNWFRGSSHQDNPMQIGGDILVATADSLGSEDVLFGGRVEFTDTVYSAKTFAADDMTLIDINPTWAAGNYSGAGYGCSLTSGGMTTVGNTLACYAADIETHASDVSGSALFAYVAWEVDVSAGGNAVKYGFTTEEGYDVDFFTVDSDMRIEAVTVTVGDGVNVDIAAGDGTASAAEARAGGVVSAYGGNRANAGNWGYFRVGDSGTPNNLASFATNDYFFASAKSEFADSIWFEGPQLIGSPPTITDAGIDEYFFGATQVLNDSNVAGGSDIFRFLKLTITETDITGLDSIYFADFWAGSTPARVFSIDNDGLVTALGGASIGGGYGSTGVTIETDGDLLMNGKLTVDGNTAIGASSASSKLHIKASTTGTVGSHPAGQFIIQNPANDVNSVAAMTGYESDGSGNPDQQLWYLGSHSGSNENITFLNRRNANLHLGTNNVTRLSIDGSGNIFINDDANTKMTLGLTINQGGNDDEILAFKSSDVGHSLGDLTEADTYGLIRKASDDLGGLYIIGVSDSDAIGLVLQGTIGVLDPTDSIPAMVLRARKFDGAMGFADLGAAETLLDVQNGTTTKFSILGDGSIITVGNIVYTPIADATFNAGDTVPSTGKIQRVAGNGAARSLTSTPSIADAANDGTCIRFFGTSAANTLTFRDEDNLANTGLALAGDVDIVLGLNDNWEGCYDLGADLWVEVSRNLNIDD